MDDGRQRRIHKRVARLDVFRGQEQAFRAANIHFPKHRGLGNAGIRTRHVEDGLRFDIIKDSLYLFERRDVARVVCDPEDLITHISSDNVHLTVRCIREEAVDHIGPGELAAASDDGRTKGDRFRNVEAVGERLWTFV